MGCRLSTFIKIPGVNPPASRPRVDLADPILPDRGALLLLDASKPSGTWPSGATSGMTIPNLAAESARALTGNSLSGTWDVATTGSISAARTSKGGMHVVAGLQSPLPSGNYARIAMPAALAEYVFENLTHSFYLSQWTRATRVPAAGSGAPPFTASVAKSDSSYLASLYRDGTEVSAFPNAYFGTSQRLGYRMGTPAAGAANLNSVATAGWVGTKPVSSSEIQTLPFVLGRSGPVQATQQSQPSLILYRCYLEDLTASGRTFAEVDAADNAAFTREVLTSGGRYHGDTYNAP